MPPKKKPNEKCHCGSDNKYKKCCMISDQNTAALEQMMGVAVQKAPPVVTSVDYMEISNLPVNERVYLVDIHSKKQGDFSCHCGLVEKEIGSNGKHWDGATNQSNGLSAMVGMSAFIEDQPTDLSIFDNNCEIMLSTIAKACKTPGAICGKRSRQRGFPIKRPSRPRKILFINQAYSSSLSGNIRKMGIFEVGVADRRLTGSMKASFTFAKTPYDEQMMIGSGVPSEEPSDWREQVKRAVDRNDSDKIKDICKIQAPDQMKKFVEENYLLYKAAKIGAPKSCRALIKYAKVDVDQTHVRKVYSDPNDIHCTPLMVAITEGNISIVRLLIRHGADFRCTSKAGVSLLCTAVKSGHPDIVEELVIAGADIHQPDNDGHTPIFWNEVALKSQSQHQMAPDKLIANILHNTDSRKRCAACKAADPVKNCPCKLEWYCNSDCQRKRWKQHKKEHKDEMELLGI